MKQIVTCVRLALAVALCISCAVPAPAGAQAFIGKVLPDQPRGDGAMRGGADRGGFRSYTAIVIQNDSQQPAYVDFDFLTIPNRKAGQFVDPKARWKVTQQAEFPFLTHIHVYIKPIGQAVESAPTICYAGGSYANTGWALPENVDQWQVSINYDPKNNTCWLGTF